MLVTNIDTLKQLNNYTNWYMDFAYETKINGKIYDLCTSEPIELNGKTYIRYELYDANDTQTVEYYEVKKCTL